MPPKKGKAGKKGRGRPPAREKSPELPPSPSPNISAGEEEETGSIGSNVSRASRASRASSVAASTDSRAPSQEGSVSGRQPSKQKKVKKSAYPLDENEEKMMLEFLQEHEMLWDIKQTDYRRTDKKGKLWEDQAKLMGKTVEHLQGWFKSVRDHNTRLHKTHSGDGAPDPTQREKWIMDNFQFLKRVVRHRPEPLRSLKHAIAGHSRDLEAAEGEAAAIAIDDDSPQPSTKKSKSKSAASEDSELIDRLHFNVEQSRDVIQRLSQKPASKLTASESFGNYVKESLVLMSKAKFRKARSKINQILTELMDEDSDEEQPAVFHPPQPVVRPSSAPAATMLTQSELYQPPPHTWRHRAPPASTWASQTSEYVQNYMLQPLLPASQLPASQLPASQYPATCTQPSQQSSSSSSSRGAALSTVVASASQVLNPTSSPLDTSLNLENISGFSSLLNVSTTGGTGDSADLSTPPAKD